MLQNPHVAFLVDDASPAGAHTLEIRGDAEPHSSGGELINPRFPNFKPEFVRVRPHRIPHNDRQTASPTTGARD
jgi:hypothetical protein